MIHSIQCKHIYICMCIRVFIYTYLYMYVYIYIYTHRYTCPHFRPAPLAALPPGLLPVVDVAAAGNGKVGVTRAINHEHNQTTNINTM